MTDSLSDTVLAGRRLMVGFDGTALSADLKYLIRGIGVGGVILFKKNIESPHQIRELTRSIQHYALSCGRDPLLIAVDQEGGEVARLRGPAFTEFPGNPHLKDAEAARRFAEVTAAELAAVGINMNMAPVLDVIPDGVNSIMGRRSFGSDPAWVSRMGRVMISCMQERGLFSVAKHFPGMGRALKDPHQDPSRIDASFPEMEVRDLIPFQDAVAMGVSGIMLSHLIYGGIDPKWPASLSPKTARDLLQERMGFSGLVLTDDLDMGAIETHYTVEVLAAQILEAQIDLALICHRTDKIEAFFEAIRKAFSHAPEVRQQGFASCRKITQTLKTLFKLPT